MSKEGQQLEYRCVNEECKEILSFLLLEMNGGAIVKCPSCGREYRFREDLIEKLGKFANLINAVNAAADILGNTNVAIDLPGHSIRVPYRLLLTRLNTFLTLDIGGEEFNFRLRVEPLDEEPITESSTPSAE